MKKENWLKIILVIVILLTTVFMIIGVIGIFNNNDVDDIDIQKIIQDRVKDSTTINIRENKFVNRIL